MPHLPILQARADPRSQNPDPGRPEPAIRRVLIYRLGSLGDTVVALPCLHLIARRFPNAERRLLTNFAVHAKAPASAAVLGEAGLVCGYMRYTVGTRDPRELLRLNLEIRKFKPEVLVYTMPVRPLKNVKRDLLFFRLAGIRRIMGVPTAEELEHRFDSASGLFEREASRLARCLRDVGDAQPDALANWDLLLSPSERAVAGQVLAGVSGDPLIVCGPGTKVQAKDWGQERWRALLVEVSRRYPSAALALIGAREDAEVGEFASAGWTGPKINLCGKLNPRQTAAMLERASVFLGPDSGPMHLAAAAGVPCVIAFSARGLPGVWYPIGDRHAVIYHQTSCYGCNLEACTVEQRRCLTSIAVEEMADAATRILDRSRP